MSRIILIVGLTIAFSSIALAQEQSDVYTDRIPSSYGAKELTLFETVAGPISPELAEQRLEASLRSIEQDRALSEQDLQTLKRGLQSEQSLWTGGLRSDPDVEYAFDRGTGRIEIVDYGVLQMPVGESITSTTTIDTAKKTAMRVIDALDQQGVIDRKEYDLKDLDIATEKSGFAQVGKGIDPKNEVVTRYLITAKRRLNGVPVMGSFVRIGIHQSGAISDLVVANRAIQGRFQGDRLMPDGEAKSVSVDVSAELAREQLREKMNLSPESWLQVERWGLVYFDSGRSEQRYYQPVYAFLVVPLSKTKDGTVAGRKSVRIIPASNNVMEELRFDPMAQATGVTKPSGDQRRDR